MVAIRQMDLPALSVQGSLLFNVIEAGLFDYNWNNGIYDTFNDSAETLSLNNAVGYEILYCNAFLNFTDPNHVPLPGEVIQFASGSFLSLLTRFASFFIKIC